MVSICKKFIVSQKVSITASKKMSQKVPITYDDHLADANNYTITLLMDVTLIGHLFAG